MTLLKHVFDSAFLEYDFDYVNGFVDEIYRGETIFDITTCL